MVHTMFVHREQHLSRSSLSPSRVASPVQCLVRLGGKDIMETGWCWQLIEKITRMQQYNFNQEDRRIAITTKQGCDKIKWAFAYGT